MTDRRPGLRARTIMGVAAAAALVAAVVLVLGWGSSPEQAKSRLGSAQTPASASSASATQAPVRREPVVYSNAGRGKTLPVASAPPRKIALALEPADEAVSELVELEDWLPNPEEDFGDEDAYFEERYGEPTPELIRSSLARTLRAQDPDRKWTPEEEKRAGDALVRLRQLRLAMRALDFTQENGEERQALVTELKTVVAEFQDVTGRDATWIFEPAPPAPEPSGIDSTMQSPDPDPSELPVGPDIDPMGPESKQTGDFLEDNL